MRQTSSGTTLLPPCPPAPDIEDAFPILRHLPPEVGRKPLPGEVDEVGERRGIRLGRPAIGNRRFGHWSAQRVCG
jgi:hypothetical protein